MTHSSSDLRVHGQDAASYLGLAGFAHAVLADLDADAAWYRDNIVHIFSAPAHIGWLLRRLPF